MEGPLATGLGARAFVLCSGHLGDQSHRSPSARCGEDCKPQREALLWGHNGIDTLPLHINSIEDWALKSRKQRRCEQIMSESFLFLFMVPDQPQMPKH